MEDLQEKTYDPSTHREAPAPIPAKLRGRPIGPRGQTVMKNFRLSADAHFTLEALALKMGLTQTAVMEHLLCDRGYQVGDGFADTDEEGELLNCHQILDNTGEVVALTFGKNEDEAKRLATYFITHVK